MKLFKRNNCCYFCPSVWGGQAGSSLGRWTLTGQPPHHTSLRTLHSTSASFGFWGLSRSPSPARGCPGPATGSLLLFIHKPAHRPAPGAPAHRLHSTPSPHLSAQPFNKEKTRLDCLHTYWLWDETNLSLNSDSSSLLSELGQMTQALWASPLRSVKQA